MDQQTPLSWPEFVPETEVILNTPFFYDEERSSLAYDRVGDPRETVSKEIGVRAVLYTHALRIIAEERRQDRLRTQPSDAEAWNEQWRQRRLTHKHLAALAIRHQAETSTLTRQLAIINNVEQYWTEDLVHDGEFRLFPDQQELLQKIAAFIQQEPPKSIEVTRISRDVIRKRFTKSAIVIAPTGSGKTIVEAETLSMCGVGKALPGSDTPVRALVLTSLVDIVQQLTGRTGDDSFRRWLRRRNPDITVGPFYTHEKDLFADVTVATKHQFIAGCENGTFFDDEYDILAIDETHHIMEPQFLSVLQNHWDGPIIGFTATPDYYDGRDARHYLPYVIQVDVGDRPQIVEYIDRRRLNDAQLYTFMVDPREHAEQYPELDLADRVTYRRVGREMLDNSALEFVANQVQEGRRGITFCERGNRLKHSTAFAERLSARTITGADGIERPIRAAIIGYVLGEAHNKNVIEQYHNGDIDVIVATDKGHEGLNAAFDFVAINRRVDSLLKLQQMIGRGTRLSEEFPVTRYAEFVLPNFNCSLWQVFGLERIEQGRVIRGQGLYERPNVFSFPLQTLADRVHGKLLSEVFVAPRGQEIGIPSDYVSVYDIAQKIAMPPEYAVHRLRRVGYTSLSRWENNQGKRTFVIYFEPNAATYFEHNPVAPMATPDMCLQGEAAHRLGVSSRFLRNLARHSHVAAARRVNPRTHTHNLYYTATDVEVMREYLSKVPIPNPGDLTLRQLRDELKVSSRFIIDHLKAFGAQPVDKWRIDDTSGLRIVAHVSPEDARKLREEMASIPFANHAEHRRLSEIEDEFNLRQHSIDAVATAEELAQGVLRRHPVSKKATIHYPVDVVRDWAARIDKRRSLSSPQNSQDITVSELCKELDVSRTLMYEKLKAVMSGRSDLQKSLRSTYQVSPEDAAVLREEFKKLPPRADQAIELTAQEIGRRAKGILPAVILQFATAEELTQKRERRASNGVPTTHYPIELVDRWIQRFVDSQQAQTAGPGDIMVAQLAKELGVRARKVYTLLERNGRPAVNMEYMAAGRRKFALHVSAEDAAWVRATIGQDD